MMMMMRKRNVICLLWRCQMVVVAYESKEYQPSLSGASI
jgi:hypothetical protein